MKSINKPKECYVITPAEGKLVKVEFGVKGYYPITRNGKEVVGEEAIKRKDEFNKPLDLTPAEVEAMLNCSICGFHNYKKMVELFSRKEEIQ